MDAYRVDLVSREFKRDPLPTLARLRERGPLVRSRIPLLGEVWLVTSYEAVKEVLHDQETFVQEPRHAGRAGYPGLGRWMPSTFRALSQNMLGRDEPDHRRLRTLVEEAFLRRSVEEMRPRIAELADRFLDDWRREAEANGGSADFLRAFARPFPLAVICELLGLPEDDRGRFMKWAARIATAASPVGAIAALSGLRKITGYLREEIQRCRQRPRPGLISAMVAAESEGRGLNEDELLAMTFLLLFAGHETTVHLIADGVLTLLEHPDQKSRLMADWGLAGSAVEEVLRFVSPVQMTKPRFASRDLECHGQTIRRGETLMLILASANTDPERFDQPERFDIGRHPNPHLAFGTGIHVCLGLKLARAETEIGFEQIFTRLSRCAAGRPRVGTESGRGGSACGRWLPLPLSPGDAGASRGRGRWGDGVG